MSSFQARTAETIAALVGPHTDVSGDTFQHIKYGTATSNGAADGTTLIDTGGDSGAARTYNGQYIVKMLSGNAKGEEKRIVEDDGAGTLTFEGVGFSAQIASGDEYQILKSPIPVLTVTTSTSTTSFTCAARTEPEDDWNGFYAMVIYGSDNGGTSPVRGEIQQITNSTVAGVFTTDAFSAAPLVGDVLAVGKLLDLGEIAASMSHEYHERPGDRINLEVGDGVVGAKGGTFGMQTWIRPSNSAAAADALANRANISPLMQGIGLVENQDKSSAISGGSSTTTVLDITTGKWENFTVGNMVIVNGEQAFIESITDGGAGVDQLTVTPPLSLAPGDTDAVVATTGYHKTTDADVRGCWIELERDGVRETMTGLKGNATLQGAGDAAPAVLAWEFQIDHYIRELERRPYDPSSAFSNAPPAMFMDRLCYIDTTKYSVGGVTATPNAQTTPKNIQGSAGINGRSGFQHTQLRGGISWSELLDTDTESLPREGYWHKRTAGDVMVMMGSHSRSFAVRQPVSRIIVAPHPTPQDSLLGTPVQWQGQDAGTVLGVAPVTNAKKPSFAFHLA